MDSFFSGGSGNGCINVIRMGVDLARGISVDDNVGQKKESSIVDSRQLMSAVNWINEERICWLKND